jgi:hypothetical protein
MARSYTTNRSNPNFNAANRLGRRYRVRAVVDGKFVEGEYASMAELIECVGEVLQIKNRSTVRALANGQTKTKKHAHVEVTFLNARD